jgi:hypothetical protein
MLDAATPLQSSISEFEFDERHVIGEFSYKTIH